MSDQKNGLGLDRDGSCPAEEHYRASGGASRDALERYTDSGAAQGELPAAAS